MGKDRYPNIMSVFGFLDGLLGCVFGLIKLIFWFIVSATLIGWVLGGAD